MNLRCSFSITSVTDTFVKLVDNDGRVSVTNDAEQVTKYIYQNYGDKRIFYQDTSGDWDELCHDKGEFTGFRAGINL